MKKLLLVSSIVSTLVMTGCATTQKSAPNHHMHEHEHDVHHHHNHKHKQGDFTATYKCNHNAIINAKYNPDAHNGVLTITAPTLSLDGTNVTVQLAPSGSGMRFINETNPNAKYEWHTKGKFGLLDITTQNKTHTLECEGDMPMHEHGDMHKHHKHLDKKATKPTVTE